MKIIISESQYDFLKYGVPERLRYIETFGNEVQQLIDDNLEIILNDANQWDDTDKVLGLILNKDIKLGFGNRAYDIIVYAIVAPKEKKGYFIDYDSIKHDIIKLIRNKFDFKCGVQIELITNE